MRRRGPWSHDEIERFLREARIPVRVAGHGASGHPLVVSLWFAPIEGRLWCATQRSAKFAAMLRRDPRCGFEVSVEAPPYRGVRGTGVATLHDDRGEEMLRLLIERYLGSTGSDLARSLLARADRETSICIEPRTLFSWDYSERMAPAG